MNVFHSIVCKGRKAMPQNNNNIKQSPSLHSTNIQEEHIIQPKNHQRTYQSDGNIRQSSASTRSKAKSLPDNASRRPSLLAMIYNAMISRRNNSGSVKDSQQSMDGSSQASFHQQMRQFNHSQPSNKWTLQFLDMHTETKFWIHFTKQTLLHWRYTVLLMTVSQLGLFAAAMLTYSAEHVTYMSTYAEKAISIDRMFENMSSLCIKGYWCSPCPPGDLCEPYSAGIDSVFMAVLTVVSIISVWLSFRLQPPQFSRM